jgi:signal transduction histidine kinase
MRALERAFVTDDTVVAEYVLMMGGLRYFEARIVSIDADRALTIVRDVTHARRAQEMNRSLAGRLLTSQEAERTRIARDLHDGVCQEVASIAVDVSYLRQRIAGFDGTEVQQVLLAIERRAAGVAEALRRLSHGLHPTVLHHIGIVAALQAHCAEVERQQHLRVTFESGGEVEPVGPRVALSLFRIAQEALRNATHHGRARQVTVSLFRTASNGLEMTVLDDGAGFETAAAGSNGGLGLVSIEERVRLVHGEVEIRSAPGHGTSIRVRVPAGAADKHHDGC